MYKKFIFLSFIVMCFFLTVIYSIDTPARESETVLIPEGKFQMGIPREMIADLAELGRGVPHMDEDLAYSWFADETPEHTVTVASFLINKYEVTNAEYRKFVNRTDYESEGNWTEWSGQGRDNHPVVGVTWNDAMSYCKWCGMRLPTEAQWEYAAKGGTTYKIFPWGDKPNPTKANYREQGEGFLEGLIRLMGLRKIDTKPVGSYPPNGYGLYDMIGNVSEWCENLHRPYPGAPEEPSLYDEGMVVRGGCWDDPNPVFIRITRRTAFPPDDSSYSRGFRCVERVEESSYKD